MLFTILNILEYIHVHCTCTVGACTYTSIILCLNCYTIFAPTKSYIQFTKVQVNVYGPISFPCEMFRLSSLLHGNWVLISTSEPSILATSFFYGFPMTPAIAVQPIPFFTSGQREAIEIKCLAQGPKHNREHRWHEWVQTPETLQTYHKSDIGQLYKFTLQLLFHNY